MSAPPHDGWPQEGSVWEHWSDLVLAAQLAALREGYTGISKNWHPRDPTKLEVVCKIAKNVGREAHCQQRLVIAVAKDPTDLAGKWIVAKLRRENLESGRHSNHRGGVGVSEGFKDRQTKRPKLSIGQIFKSWKSMHALEGSLRASARIKGRYISSYPNATQDGSSLKTSTYSYYFNCVHGDRCQFYIRLAPHEQHDGIGWICDKLCLQHSCFTIASQVFPNLQKALDFWPRLKISGEYSSPTDRKIRKNDKLLLTKVVQHLGDYPVLAPGRTLPRPVLPLPAPRSFTTLVSGEATSIATKEDVEEDQVKKKETVSKKKQRTIELLESLAENPQALKKSKSNPSSKQALPPAALHSTTLTSSNSPADTAQTDALQNRQGSLIKAIDSLFSIRRLILDLDHNVSTALALDDLEGAGKYEAEMVELNQRRDDIQTKVNRKKRKVERQKERMKAKQMIEKKIVKNTSDPPKVKRARKVKKSKKEKKMH